MSYYILRKSDPSPDTAINPSHFEADRVFRSEKLPGRETIRIHNRNDWHLVPTEDEEFYKSKTLPGGLKRERHTKKLERFIDAPPMIKQIMKAELQKMTGKKIDNECLKIPLQLKSDYVELTDGQSGV